MSLLVHVLRLEDRHHLRGELLDLRRTALSQIERRKLQAGHGHVVAHLQLAEALAHLQEGAFGAGLVTEPQLNLSFQRAEPQEIEAVPDLHRPTADLRQHRLGLFVPAELRQGS